MQKLEVITLEEIGEINPSKYEIFGIMSSYLNTIEESTYAPIREENMVGIVNINDAEELWDLDDTDFEFKEEFADRNFMDSGINLAIGYMGFGKLRHKSGLEFKAILEQNTSPKIIYVSERTIRILRSI